MKLSLKIMTAFFLIILILVAVDGYLSVARSTRFFEEAMKEQAMLLGHVMESMVIEVWTHKGQDRALDLLGQANRAERAIHIRWVWLDEEPGTAYGPVVAPQVLRPVLEGRTVSRPKAGEAGGAGFLYTYVPVRVGGGRAGALEFAQSLSAQTAFTRETAFRVAALSALLLVSGAAVLWIFGTRFIERPLARVMAKTERISRGDFSPDLPTGGRDELARLANAINRMCVELAASREALGSETERRISALEQLRHTERLATLGRLASGIAHELGTPLNVIGGRAKIIGRQDLSPDEVSDNARIIGEQAERMSKIIRETLDFARRREPQRGPVDIRELIGQTVELLEATARKAGAHIEVTGDLQPSTVSVDRVQIQQVLANLVMNGLQAMPQGGRLEIRLSRRRAGPPGSAATEYKDCALIEVCDEGRGIAPEELSRIFEPFFTTKGVEGTGLGLPIAQGIVEGHGGWITAESNAGKGTVFSVYLPLTRQPQDPPHKGPST